MDSLQIGRTEQEKLVASVQMMSEVTKRIKQIPELPSEKATDNHPLIKVEFPDEGEILTHMKGYDYPYRGYPYYEFVDKIDLIKKLSRNLQSGFYHGLKNTKFRYLLIPFIPTLGKSLFWAFTYTFHRLIDRFQMRTNRYSKAVSELYRAASIGYADESARDTDIRKMLRDIECMILEFDNAYRFRFQDLIVQLDKEALRKNPRKEIIRLLDIWIERENGEDIKNSWRLLQFFVKYYLRFDKKLQNTIVRILLEIDLEKCALTPEDKYFSVPRKDYKFGFMLNPTPEDEKLIKKAVLQKEYDQEFDQITKQSTLEHEILSKLHGKEISLLPASASIMAEFENQKSLITEKVNLTVRQLQQNAQQEISKLELELLSDEQKFLISKQNNEKLELDQKFETQLIQAEKNYLEQKNKI